MECMCLKFPIYLIYGLVYFLIGFSILVVNPSKLTSCPLAKHLWLLALFSITHASGEWIEPLTALSSHQRLVPQIVGLFTLSISYIFLLFFGFKLLQEFTPGKNIYRWLPYILITLWLSLTLFSYSEDIIKWLEYSRLWGKYLLSVPGAFMSSLAFYFQYKNAGNTSLNNIDHSFTKPLLKGFSLIFFFYGLFSIIGSYEPFCSNFFLKGLLNYADISWKTIIRIVTGFFILYLIVKSLKLFYENHSDKLQQELKEKTINEAKSKISQDLHDGTIQTIYAIGLKLKAIKFLVNNNKSHEKVNTQIDDSVTNLNSTIKHLRQYISSLQSTSFYTEGLQKTIAVILKEYQGNLNLNFNFTVNGELKNDISIIRLHHIAQIIRELLSNVVKHSQASEITIELNYYQDFFEIIFKDNGVGFDLEDQKNTIAKEGNFLGLKNIEERARNIAAKLVIQSKINQGTQVSIKAPYGGDIHAKD